jgi:type II secretory pathway pseudopilin PulG
MKSLAAPQGRARLSERAVLGVKPRLRRARRSLPTLLAFTRVELLAVLAALTFLAAVVFPALANSRPRSARVICANNLRQIGTGFQLWGNDYNDTLPQEVPASQGGTTQHPLAPNVWLHLAWISNEVANPKIFLCPSDSGRPAFDFTGNPAGGYLHPNFRNAATSYFLGYTGFFTPNNGDATIAGDRNVSTAGVTSCSRFNTALNIPTPPPAGIAQWTPGLHGSGGNVLTYDGRVQELDNAGLRRALDLPGTDNASKHIITPR